MNPASLIQLHLSFHTFGTWYHTYEEEHTLTWVIGDFTGLQIFNFYTFYFIFPNDFTQHRVPDEVHFWMGKGFFRCLLVAVQHAFVMQYYNSNFRSKLCDIHTFFNCLVATAYDYHFLILEKFCITGCAIRNTHTSQFSFSRNSQYSCFRASGNDNCFCLIFMLFGFYNFDIAAKVYRLHFFLFHFYTKALCMLCHIICQIRTAGSFITRIVYNFSCRKCTSTQGTFFYN